MAAMTHLLVLLALLVAAAKEPWALTVEERIALRSDPQLARERIRGGQTRAASTSSKPSPWVDRFNGKDHPELFLPHEVFDEFISLGFNRDARSRQNAQEGFRSEVRQHGLPADFWLRLESLSAAFIADRRAELDLLRTISRMTDQNRRRAEQALALKQRDVCRSRADALAAARDAFGRERFDRFLYEVMATKMFLSADKIPEPQLLRGLEEGCR
jgi:hypothetical protein